MTNVKTARYRNALSYMGINGIERTNAMITPINLFIKTILS
jgi:hypothetical protein